MWTILSASQLTSLLRSSFTALSATVPCCLHRTAQFHYSSSRALHIFSFSRKIQPMFLYIRISGFCADSESVEGKGESSDGVDKGESTWPEPPRWPLLLGAACERNDIDLSTRVFKDLLTSRGHLSNSSYHNLVKSFIKTDDCDQLLRFAKEVSELTYPRNVIIINRIIFAFAECGQTVKALLLFNQIKSFKCEPDLITYNIILDILGRAGRIDEMLREFSSMKEAGVVPDIISYNTLLNSVRKVGRLDICLVLLKEMSERGTYPDLLTYTSLIESFGRSGNVEESLRLFQEMKLKQIRPSKYIYRSLITNLRKTGKVELAITLTEELNSSRTSLAGPKDFKRRNR